MTYRDIDYWSFDDKRPPDNSYINIWCRYKHKCYLAHFVNGTLLNFDYYCKDYGYGSDLLRCQIFTPGQWSFNLYEYHKISKLHSKNHKKHL